MISAISFSSAYNFVIFSFSFNAFREQIKAYLYIFDDVAMSSKLYMFMMLL